MWLKIAWRSDESQQASSSSTTSPAAAAAEIFGDSTNRCKRSRRLDTAEANNAEFVSFIGFETALFSSTISNRVSKILLGLITLTLLCCASANAELTVYNKKLEWMVGKWRSEFSGKIVWPTVPTMTYGEELIIGIAPQAKTTKAQFFNYSARAWSHSTKDHFHDEWGFMTVDSNGNATLMTTGNNGFTTYEVGKVLSNKLILTLKDIGRISFSRDLPVEDLRRTYIKHDDNHMEQILEMRTATHPRSGYLEHTRVIYKRVVDTSHNEKTMTLIEAKRQN